jgi:hypothetical protein
MASTINTSNTVGSFAKKADGTNALTLQTSTTNALAIGTDQNVICSSTGALSVPSGTTAQRPSSPVNGMLRYNTTIPQLEIYIGSNWTALP